MKRAEIQAMTDRELDVWIAEHVLEWHHISRYGAVGPDGHEHRMIPGPDIPTCIPRCSEDANYMLQVLEKLERWGFEVRIEMCAYVMIDESADPGGEYAELCYNNIGHAEFREAVLLPRAVCEAAVQAAVHRQERKEEKDG